MKFSLSKLLMIVGFVFLYLPIAILVLFSFNESRFINIWSGFSFRWYKSLIHDPELIKATLTSINIAASSATIAVIVGTMAGYSLTRFGNFFGRKLFKNILAAPFMIPEIITGFGLLLLFVALEQFISWPRERGLLTIILAHTTIGIAYVTVLVQARLTDFDRSLEEAASDLGAKPIVIFFSITLPIISKNLIAGWLLSFTISLDDLIIASFTSGPGATTLPMLIYSRIKSGINPQINALATVMIIAVVISIAMAYKFFNRQKTYA